MTPGMAFAQRYPYISSYSFSDNNWYQFDDAVVTMLEDLTLDEPRAESHWSVEGMSIFHFSHLLYSNSKDGDVHAPMQLKTEGPHTMQSESELVAQF
jgi:hypothetical protein